MALSDKLIMNELVDFLEVNDILYIQEQHSVELLHPRLGKCTFWAKKNKLHIHNKNKWVDNGFYFVKKNL